MYAASGAYEEIVSLLLRQGANPNFHKGTKSLNSKIAANGLFVVLGRLSIVIDAFSVASFLPIFQS